MVAKTFFVWFPQYIIYFFLLKSLKKIVQHHLVMSTWAVFFLMLVCSKGYLLCQPHKKKKTVAEMPTLSSSVSQSPSWPTLSEGAGYSWFLNGMLPMEPWLTSCTAQVREFPIPLLSQKFLRRQAENRAVLCSPCAAQSSGVFFWLKCF